MIEAIVEVWCSPLRQEDYSIKIIPLSAGSLFSADEDIKEFISWPGDFFYQAFGYKYDEVKGLWKVVFKIGLNYVATYDWEGIPDCDVEFEYTELFKGQCESWVETKYTWLELTGKIDEYLNKPWKIDNTVDYYIGEDYEFPSSSLT